MSWTKNNRSTVGAKPGPAPTVRPARVLQRKTALQQPAQNNSNAHAHRAPTAPPAYRPQPTPKVLQVKATAAPVRGTNARPVFRSYPKKIVQPKLPAVAPKAPPVYRPQPTPRVLQSKQSPATPACCKEQRVPDKSRVVQRQQGRVGLPVQSKVIQRYSLIAKPKGKLSEDKNIIVTEEKRYLYATAESIENANRQLALAGPHGSLIRLVKTGEAKTTDAAPGKNFYRVTPEISISAHRARLAHLPTSFHKDLKPGGAEMKIWADCRRASEVVTGASSGPSFNDRVVKVNGSLLEAYSGKLERPSHIANDSTTARLSFQVYASQIGSFMTKYGPKIFNRSKITTLFPEIADMEEPQLLAWLEKVAKAAPTNISIAERLYASLVAKAKDQFHKETLTNEYANPEIGDAYSTVTEYGIPGFKESGDDWAFHWGGVVMKGGSDNVTLENLSVSNETIQNSNWFFAMYGTVDPAQSFHGRQTDTGHHGNIATTITAVTVGSTENRRLQALRDQIVRLRQLELMTGADQREALLNTALEYNELADSIGRAMITEYEVFGNPDREFTRSDLSRVHALKKRFIPK